MVNLKTFIVLPTLTLFFSTAAQQARNENGVKPGETIGGPHGTAFNDGYLTGADHKRISSITLSGCGNDEHVFGLALTYRSWDYKGPGKQEVSVTHGRIDPSDSLRLDLAADEYITNIWLTTYLHKHNWLTHWTRIASLAVRTNKGHEIKRCGADDPADHHWEMTSKDGSALLHLAGAVGDGLDNLTPYWLPKDNF